MIGDDEPGEQGDVLWQNPVRFNHEVVPRVARIVRHRVYVSAGYDGRSSGGREDEIHVETFSRDARGRSRWCDATEFESVAILKAALASAYQVLDAHAADERRRREEQIESKKLVTRVEHAETIRADPTPPPRPPLSECAECYWSGGEHARSCSRYVEPPPAPAPCGRNVPGHAFGCEKPAGHDGDCEADIPF